MILGKMSRLIGEQNSRKAHRHYFLLNVNVHFADWASQKLWSWSRLLSLDLRDLRMCIRVPDPARGPGVYDLSRQKRETYV